MDKYARIATAMDDVVEALEELYFILDEVDYELDPPDYELLGDTLDTLNYYSEEFWDRSSRTGE